MGPLRAGLVYFFLVFGAGFVLGVVRTLFVTPWVGASRAELLETPLMLLVVWRAARWLQPRLRPGAALPAGLLALAILLGAETGVGVFLRQMTVVAVFLHRDPLPAVAYYGALLVFGLLPALLERRAGSGR
jgi:hypothetical protein